MNDHPDLWSKSQSPDPFDQIMTCSSVEDFRKLLRAYHCTRCPLSSEIKQNPTTSRGNPNRHVMMVGEAPGHNEMIQGIPFVGKAGQLMDKIFESIGWTSEKDIYVTNICRCRPVDNRTPLVHEAKTCISYLKKEIDLIKPRFILTLGATSAKYLLGSALPSTAMKDIVGRFFQSEEYPHIDFFVLYHPAALLYNSKLRDPMWEHIQLFRDHLSRG
ncbi:MAG TPA: uracil-DNA glycosylase [Spirochaetes bacterium]|nr:uracil-DNA glycosylase [Spirochaetota bacterium]